MVLPSACSSPAQKLTDSLSLLSGINIKDTQLKEVNDTSVLTTQGSANNFCLAQSSR
jgi:hypothetical protein